MFFKGYTPKWEIQSQATETFFFAISGNGGYPRWLASNNFEANLWYVFHGFALGPVFVIFIMADIPDDYCKNGWPKMTTKVRVHHNYSFEFYTFPTGQSPRYVGVIQVTNNKTLADAFHSMTCGHRPGVGFCTSDHSVFCCISKSDQSSQHTLE